VGGGPPANRFEPGGPCPAGESLAGSPILKVDTIWVHIRDVRRARVFYRDALGLAELHYDEASQHASYRLPRGPPLAMHKQGKGEPGRRAGTVTGLYLRVADVRKAARAIKRRGGRVTDEPEKMPWGKWNATVADPDGNEFVLTD